jgi:hypothetical protein
MIHGWSAFGGPTMVDTTSKWEDELERWVEPFLDCLGHKARRRMCPLFHDRPAENIFFSKHSDPVCATEKVA